MKLAIREADLDRDREVVIDTLQRFLTPGSDARRYEWLYRANPHGRARTWLAVDEQDGAVVGVASSFARRVWLDGAKRDVWVLGDFCIAERYRSLGPALKLQRACLEAVGASSPLCYDFPNRGMTAVYRRLGVEPLGEMVRLAKPLRVDRQVEARVRPRPVARAVSAVGNVWLRLTDRGLAPPPGHTVARLEARFDERFTRLADSVAPDYGVCVDRSAEFLNWRYLDAPLNSYEVAVVYRGSEPVAYAVFEQLEHDATIVDLFGADEPPAQQALVQHVVENLRHRGVSTVSCPVLESHRFRARLVEIGFRPRETTPVFVYAAGNGPAAHDREWFLMQGDRDS